MEQPMLSEDAKRDLLTRRILQLEMDKFGFELTIEEMTAVDAAMEGKTDAPTALKEAQAGLNAVTVRLRTLRGVWSKTYPSEEPPSSVTPS